MKEIPKESLETIITDSLYCISANELPEVCLAYGLEEGGTSEAFQSKKRYVSKRLHCKSNEELYCLANKISQDYPNYEIKEILIKHSEDSRTLISSITRRKIINDIKKAYGLNLSFIAGDILFSEFINKVWGNNLPDTLRNSRLMKGLLDLLSSEETEYNEEFDQIMCLIECSNYQFIKFLEGFVDPEVRKGEDQKKWVGTINNHLQYDSYRLKPDSKISGEVVYKVNRCNDFDGLGAPSKSLEEKIKEFGIDAIEEEFLKAQENIESKPKEAVEAAKNILESCFKTILEEKGHTLTGKEKFTTLWADIKKEFGMEPKNLDNKNLQDIISGLNKIVLSVNELRNDSEGGHGESGAQKTKIKVFKPLPRHARLVVHSAHTIVDYLFEVWKPENNK